MKYLITILAFSIPILLLAQTNSVIDTSVWSHSKYNEIDQGIIVNEYHFSEKDWEIYNDKLSTREKRQSLLKKYQPWSYELVHCDSPDYITPYQAYSLNVNGELYDFVHPIARYRMKGLKSIAINLINNCNHCDWSLNKDQVIVSLMTDGLTVSEQVTSFPVQYNIIADNVDEIKITVQNEYKERMYMWITLD